VLRFPSEIIVRVRPAYEHRRVVVTGGAGFIGSHLVDALVSLGARVSVLDDLSNSSASYVAELVELEPDRVSFVHGSILDSRALQDAFEPTTTRGGGSADDRQPVVKLRSPDIGRKTNICKGAIGISLKIPFISTG